MPVATADLVANERVTGGVVRNAQQRLGHAHQRHTLLAGERELLHQRLHPAADLVAAQTLHQARGHLLNGGLLCRIGHMGQLHQHRQALGFRSMPGGGDGSTQVCLRQHVLSPVKEGLRCHRCVARLRRGAVGIVNFHGVKCMGCTHGCNLQHLTTLNALHILHDGLFDEPMGCSALQCSCFLDATALGFIDLDSECDCGHGCTFKK